MLHRKDLNWIGFQEAQKTICSLKQEVEIAEKKLLNVKRTLYENTSKNKSLKPQLVPEKPPEPVKLIKQPPHFIKETFPVPPKISNKSNERAADQTVPKEILITSEEEPNFLPFKYPHLEPLDVKRALIKSSFDGLSKLSSSPASLSTSDSKHSSSEGTSSLIAGTYKNGTNAFTKDETKIKEVTSDISISVSSSTTDYDDVYTRKKKHWIKKSRSRNTEDVGMEWKEFSGTKPALLHNKFKLDNISKIKDIIDKQKERQKQYELQLENGVPFSFEHSVFKKSVAMRDPPTLKETAEEEVTPAPVRKVCTVKSFPVYKGFSAPPKKLPTGTRWRKQRNKYTIAKSSNEKSGCLNDLKRIKTVVTCKSDFISASHWRKKENDKDIEEKEKSLKEAIHDNLSGTSTKEHSEDEKHKSDKNNNAIKGEIQSILKENQLPSEESDDVENGTYSKEAKISSEITKTDNNITSNQKENKNPLKKFAKRKAKKSPEKKALSPLLKPYDVEKIREFMKKKREERRKRHQDENRKQLHEVQKRKQSLEKLLEYQKHNKKTVTKSKTSQRIEQESKQDNNIIKNQYILKDSASQKTHTFEERYISCPQEISSKKKFSEESQGKQTSKESQQNSIKPHKRKQENEYSDFTVPKFISVSVTPVSQYTKTAKNAAHATSSQETPVKENKIFAKPKMNPPGKSPLQNNIENHTEQQILEKQKTKDVEMIDVENSHTYKVPDMLRSISSASTPSKNSHIIGLDEELLMTDLKNTERILPERKLKKVETLKDLMKSINMMTKPLEPFLRTRKWIEDNPPQSILKKRVAENSDLLNGHHMEHPEKDTDSLIECSKSETSKKSSFKESVAGIGDVNLLYAEILGKKSTLEPARTEKTPVFTARNEEFLSSHNKTEDEIIEGSIASIDEYVLESPTNLEVNQQSQDSSESSHFSDLQKAHIVSDPYNLINTWKRKPLGVAIDVEDGQKTCGLPGSKVSDDNVPFEEIYKSLINDSSHLESKISECNITGISQSSLPNQSFEQSSITSIQLSVDHTASNENVSKVSKTTILSNHSFQNRSESRSSTTLTSPAGQKQLSGYLSCEKNAVSETKSYSKVTTARDSKLKKTKSLQTKQVESNNSFSENEISEQLHESKPDMPSGISEMIVSGTINSDNSLEIAEHLHESKPDLPSGISEMIISGTINSDYSLEIAAEESNMEESEESVMKEVEELNREAESSRASASGSSISEVISVVQNSKGFESSAEDLQSEKISVYSKQSDASLNSGDNKPNDEDKFSLKSLSHKNVELQFNRSKEPKSNSASSSNASQKDSSKHSALLLKHDQLQNIHPASQNSVTIDFRQPLRLTLPNRESVQSNQGLDAYDNQYLQTQVVTRLASEAAAAAVVAVFETQKILLGEKNYLELINPYGKTSGSKKTQYSSDFESSPNPKSTSQSPESSAGDSKESKSVHENISEGNNNGLSSKNGSIEEKISSEHSNHDSIAQFKSSQSTINTEDKVASVSSLKIINKNQKKPQGKRKISGNMSSPSPASLSDNESVSSETVMSSHSNFSQFSDSVHSDDSFGLDVMRRMAHEEKLRARHQLSLLQIQEKDLVEKARSQMMWLEVVKKKLREKGADRKVSAIKRRQRELIIRLRQERAQLQYMQGAYKSLCEKPHSFMEDKKKLLEERSFLGTQLQNNEMPHCSKEVDGRTKDSAKQKSSSSTPTTASDNDNKTIVDEESVSEVPELHKGLASNSSHESVVETQASEPVKTSNSSQNKSQQNSPNSPFSPLNASQSNSNLSLHSNNSLESALKDRAGLKKLEASKRHLTKREQRIFQRRKQVESLLQWQMKLDSEEMAVRELEQKALDLVDNSKKRTKHYVSSSGSTYQDDDKRKEPVYDPNLYTVGMPSHPRKVSENTTVLSSIETENKTPQTNSDESIPTNLSENGLEDGTESDKQPDRVSSVPPSSGSPPENIKSTNGESSIHTVETTENGSQIDEVISEVSLQISPSVKDKSSSSDIYSESFESTGSRKSNLALSPPSPLNNFTPSKSIKKDRGLGIRLPLVPKKGRRHDSSGSDDSYTISQSETASDQSDIEVRIHALTEELKRRKAEAEMLKKEQKKKNREKLKGKELSLQKQLEAYNQIINQAKLELEHQIESAVSPTQTNDVVVKPRIKWPRPEQVIDSRRVRKQATISTDTLAIEKKSENVNSSPEINENLGSESTEKGKAVRKLFSEAVLKTNEENASKEISEKSFVDSKEISEVLSINNSSEIQEISEIEQSKSVSSEVPSDIKEVSDTNEIPTDSTVKQQTSDEIKSFDSDFKQSYAGSSNGENKSLLDTVESKSLSDTYISESSSSKSTDQNNSQQNADSSSSNRTVSSDDDQSSKVEEMSGDCSQKPDLMYSRDTSHETKSTDDSISENFSIANSAELVSENSSKNSQNNSFTSSGTSSKNEMTDLESKHQQLPLNTSKSKEIDPLIVAQSSNSKNHKKFVPSETIIVNIVNYLSLSLIDDAFQIMFKISKEKCISGSLDRKLVNIEVVDVIDFVNIEIPVKSQNQNKKTAEAISISLFDTYLKDALDSVFKIVRALKNNTNATMLFDNHELSPQQNIASSISLNSFNSNSSNFEVMHPVNQVTQDVNENQIFMKSADWNSDIFVPQTDQQIQQLEQQQLVLQQYSYFYRKIPNKPPPPYTPPSSTAPNFEFPFVKEKPKEEVPTIKEVSKHVDQITDHALEILLNAKQKGSALLDISLPAEDSLIEKLGLTVPHQAVFVDLIFDLTKEILLEHYSETKQIPQPWLRPRKLTPKPLLPSSKDSISSNILKETKKALKIDIEPSSTNQRKQVMWSSLKLGRKKRDFVDTILISELKEEEPDWVNYDQDEVTVKQQIADSIFNDLITDTVNVFKDLQTKINR